MFRGTLLGAPFSSPFSNTCIQSDDYSFAALFFGEFNPCHSARSLIEVSSEHTPINLPSRRSSLDTNIDDLATTVDASETINSTDVGQLISALICSGAGTFKRRETTRNRFVLEHGRSVPDVE